MPPELSVVIPTLNEAASIGKLVRELRSTAHGLRAAHEVLVLDGGSADATCREAETAGARVLPDSGGFAESLRRGIREAQGTFVLIIDGDGSHPVDRLTEMWSRRHEADIVVGSRLVTGGGMDLPGYRRWLTLLLNGMFRRLMRLPVADSSSGFRLYRAAALRGLADFSNGFEFQQETLLHVLDAGGTAVEVPIFYSWRIGGASKARILPLGLGYLLTLLRHWKRGLGL